MFRIESESWIVITSYSIHYTKLYEDVLNRAMRFATVIDVVREDEGQYALTEVGRFLLKDVQGSLYIV